MPNPWLNIPASDYESHMGLPEVRQLEFLSEVFKNSIEIYDSSEIAYLGAATGNGLEFISNEVTKRVTAIDINSEYLDILAKRYQDKINGLKVIEADLIDYESQNEAYTLIFAGLLFEYLSPNDLLHKIRFWLKKSGVLVVVLQLDDKNHNKISVTPYTSLNQLSSIMNLVSITQFQSLAQQNGLFEFECNRVILDSGKEFYIGAYKLSSNI